MTHLLRGSLPRFWSRSLHSIRKLATDASAVKDKPEGDISSIFISLSGGKAHPLPERFAQLKNRLLAGHEEQIKASWERLLERLHHEIKIVKRQGPAIIPVI